MNQAICGFAAAAICAANPQIGQQQTPRLIAQDHVTAMLGSYQSSVSLVATAVAERQGVSF